jgi:hypothetical protein
LYRLNSKGQVALWEIALTLCVIAGLYIWWSAHKPSEANTFKDKSQQHQFTLSNNGFRLFDISCVPKGISDNWGKDVKNPVINEVKK